MQNNKKGNTLLRDSDWSVVEGALCRVIEFTPFAKMSENGGVEKSISNLPYASVVIECPKIKGKATGFITHKIDFAMLWGAFNKPLNIEGVQVEIIQDQEQWGAEREICLVWSKKHYKRGRGLFKAILPRLCVMLSPKGAYEIATNPNSRPELKGEEARFLAQRPFVMWKPEVKR